MKSIFSVILIISLSFISCQKNNQVVEVRISNDSEYDFKKVIVNTDANYLYGDVESNAVTEYQIHNTAFAYAYLETYILDTLYVIQPADFIGELPLTSGKYTYVIKANKSNEKYGKLEMTLRED